MTIRYVGIGGSDASNGLTWATRKLTLNGVEDTPVVAGDTVYVGPGTYRELLTCDVSGTTGNPVTYIGDVKGVNTDGIGGAVRVTGSADDIALTRSSCITATSKNYRTIQGFLFDGSSAALINLVTACGNWIIDKCYFQSGGVQAVSLAGTGTTNVIQNCSFIGHASAAIIVFTHTSVVDNAAHTVQNCIFVGGSNGVRSVRVGGITVKNSTLIGCNIGIIVGTALTVGQTLTVNNCILHGCSTALSATTVAEFVDNYNNIFACTTARTNVTAGANSLADITMFESRWFFEMISGGRIVTPFDLASDAILLNVAGTSPTTSDMRGTAVQGSQREWGALEYDATLLINKSARARFQIVGG